MRVCVFIWILLREGTGYETRNGTLRPDLKGGREARKGGGVMNA